MAIEHATITDPDIHEPKGAAAALAGQVYIADGAGSGAWENQAGTPSNSVSVETASDLPAAVAGVITLDSDTFYRLEKNVDIGSDRIELGSNSIISGVHRELSGIVSTTTGALITASGVNLRLEDWTANAPSASVLFKVVGSGSETCSLRNMESSTHTGGIAEVSQAGATIMDYSVYIGGVGGVSFTGACGSFTCDTVVITNQTGTAVDLGSATFDRITIDGGILNGVGGADIGMAGLPSGGNINAGGSGRVEDVDFNGTTPLSGITTSDNFWVFEVNKGIPSTSREAAGFVNGNATATTIAVTSTPVKVDVVGFTANTLSQFTTSVDGRLTYTGNFPLSATVLFAVQGTGASGSNTFNFYVAKNGVVIPDSKLGKEFSSTATSAVTSFTFLDMEENDYIEVWVDNDTSTTNFNAVDLKLAVR